MNYCPVCGFAMAYPPTDFHICPSCGTEFGYDDSGTTYEELRSRWILSGPTWWSPADPRPKDWDPYEQMRRVVLNAPGTFAGHQGLAIQGTSAIIPTEYYVIKKKRAASQGHMRTGFELTSQGMIAASGGDR